MELKMKSPREQSPKVPENMKYTREMLRRASNLQSPGNRSKMSTEDDRILAVMAALKQDPDYEPVPADNSRAMALESEKED